MQDAAKLLRMQLGIRTLIQALVTYLEAVRVHLKYKTALMVGFRTSFSYIQRLFSCGRHSDGQHL